MSCIRQEVFFGLLILPDAILLFLYLSISFCELINNKYDNFN